MKLAKFRSDVKQTSKYGTELTRKNTFLDKNLEAKPWISRKPGMHRGGFECIVNFEDDITKKEENK